MGCIVLVCELLEGCGVGLVGWDEGEDLKVDTFVGKGHCDLLISSAIQRTHACLVFNTSAARC